MSSPIDITFVTSSPFKREENAEFLTTCRLNDGTPVADAFSFSIVDNTLKETLEVELERIVRSEVKQAYTELKRPCIVEHAGLIFSEYAEQAFPGGLTKPMWNTLGDSFLEETKSVGRGAIAKAVIGYCDGQEVFTFSGQTVGMLSDAPRGHRRFYWDTIFIPSEDNPSELTYAEIVERHGLSHKLQHYSQSAKAMVDFLEWRREHSPPLWDVIF